MTRAEIEKRKRDLTQYLFDQGKRVIYENKEVVRMSEGKHVILSDGSKTTLFYDDVNVLTSNKKFNSIFIKCEPFMHIKDLTLKDFTEEGRFYQYDNGPYSIIIFRDLDLYYKYTVTEKVKSKYCDKQTLLSNYNVYTKPEAALKNIKMRLLKLKNII